mmetsp:Transcript_21533/g.37858  ORF Transcript_21533/g.37858 Transcript_21533/m.37858 type:complete len:281 (-) Transcript_21533:311-1153(-)
MQLTIKINLSFRNVSSKIRNRVSNIIVRHRKDRKLGDGTVTSDHTSGTFINGGKIGVHVTWVTTTSRNFLTGSRNLTKGIGVRRHVSKNDKHVQITFVRKELGSSESQTGSNDTFNGRIVGQVKEQSCTLHSTTFFEIGAKETGGFHVHTHSTEDNGKVLFVSVHGVLLLDERGLTGNLGSDFVVRKTSSRENRDLLTTSNGVHDINSRNTGLNHSLRVVTRGRVDWLTVDVQVSLGKNRWGLINDLTRSVEGTTKHLLRNSHFQDITSKFTFGFSVVDS